jgi:hypothetical protein
MKASGQLWASVSWHIAQYLSFGLPGQADNPHAKPAVPAPSPGTQAGLSVSHSDHLVGDPHRLVELATCGQIRRALHGAAEQGVVARNLVRQCDHGLLNWAVRTSLSSGSGPLAFVTMTPSLRTSMARGSRLRRSKAKYLSTLSV